MPYVIPPYRIIDTIPTALTGADKRGSWYDDFRRYVSQVRDRVRRTHREDYMCPLFKDYSKSSHGTVMEDKIPNMDEEVARSGIDDDKMRWYERVNRAPLRGKCHKYWRLLLAYRIYEESWSDCPSAPNSLPDPKIVCYFCGMLVKRCAEENYANHLVRCADFERNMDSPDGHEDKLVQCPYAGGHFVPPAELERHKAECVWRPFIEKKREYMARIDFSHPYPLVKMNKAAADTLRASENIAADRRWRAEEAAKERKKLGITDPDPNSTPKPKKKWEEGDDDEYEEENHIGKWAYGTDFYDNGIPYREIKPKKKSLTPP